MNNTRARKAEALTDALRRANETGRAHWVVVARIRPVRYEIVEDGWEDYPVRIPVRPNTSKTAEQRLLARYGLDPGPRELYRVTVDLDRWIAEDPGTGRTRREHPTSTRNDYHEPIYTLSRQKVTGVLAQFGADYVTVEYADVTGLRWSGGQWPRRKPALVLYSEDGALCPHCGAADSIVEIDYHSAESPVTIDQDGLAGVHQQPTSRNTLRYECKGCRDEVLLPNEPTY